MKAMRGCGAAPGVGVECQRAGPALVILVPRRPCILRGWCMRASNYGLMQLVSGNVRVDAADIAFLSDEELHDVSGPPGMWAS